MGGAGGVYGLLAPEKKMREEIISSRIQLLGEENYLAANTALPEPSLI